MNKTAIKNYAIWARVQLIEAVKQRAYEYEITADGVNDGEFEAIGGKPLSIEEINQRRRLVAQVDQKGYEQVMEEAAYTWFNRFIALRFMEVNGYLPSKIRVFTDENGAFKPEILSEAMTVELDGLNRDVVFDLLDRQDNEALYKYLLITQCNALHEGLPYMFEKIANWTELLFPANLLRADSVIARMVADIPEPDWTDQVQIIGWLYQYYVSEKHDQIVNIYKGTVKKEDIPAATQLFTTDWVVRYMVDNSLGRYWIERHPESKLREKLQFFATPKAGEIAHVNEPVKPQELTFFDPCMGSGHILVYAFDVLMEIYKECGYGEREAAAEIVQNNIFGLDIDKRCSQLAYFAVVMKARSYDRRFLTRGIKPHIFSIRESNGIDTFTRSAFMPDKEQNEVGEYLVELFRHAKEIGSLKTAKSIDYEAFQNYLDDCAENALLDMDFTLWKTEEKPLMEQLAEQAKILSKKYAVVCTNPPYMNKLEGHLKNFVTTEFKPYSGDLFSVFIFHNFDFCKENGYSAFMTPFVWMFIKTYENLRQYIITNKHITSLIQMEYSAFEEATVPICSFVLQNTKNDNPSLCFRLSDFKGGMEVQKQKVLEALDNKGCGYFYEADQSNFSKIPGSPVAYWVSEDLLKCYGSGVPLGKLAAPRKGNSTSDNNRFLRLWFEVDINKENYGCKQIVREDTLVKRWFPYNKGGGYKKWYGYNEYMIDWYDDAAAIRAIKTAVIANYQYFMKPGLTWSTVTSGGFSLRKFGYGYIFDNGGCCVFELGSKSNYILGVLNSIVFTYIFGQSNPTINSQSGEVAKFPVIIDQNSRIDTVVDENVAIARTDWDSYETSWDFERNPLV